MMYLENMLMFTLLTPTLLLYMLVIDKAKGASLGQAIVLGIIGVFLAFIFILLAIRTLGAG
ncbi:TPA: hypothetical protein WI685_001403 [Neisseria meningitidis]|jgi:hypothetical protein|uniref:hypothetical protein n=1 Tax=Neisseria sicca TaxID=490 RepID=UPI000C327907|nr:MULTISPECIES: hypothetical protein [Neisseria]